MWTFDNVPKAEIAKRYGVQLTDQWLAHLQKSVVRLETGCTASFVSAEGLVLTNHHCVAECLADNSSAQRDLMPTATSRPGWRTNWAVRARRPRS